MPVAPRDVGEDGPSALFVVPVVGVVEREVSDTREDRFDPIQPRSVGRREDELHVVVGGPGSHFGSLVRREVVEDEVEARRERVARANVREEQQHLATALAPVAPHHEPIGLDVVRREILAGAMQPPVGRAQPGRVPDPAPRAPMIRAHFDGPELVETDHPAVRGRRLVERADAFFLVAKSGSGLSFQVLVRWKEKPWSRRMRPSVVACSSLTTRHRTRWAASFRRDHTVNGRPRSCGRVPATSRMTLISSGAYFDGRPDAFRGRSAAKPPALNRRINSRTYSSWKYNRPAMARARIPCPEKATTCARRKYAGGQVGPGAGVLVLMFDLHHHPGPGRLCRMAPVARLNARLLIGGDHEVVRRQGVPLPDALVKIQDPPGLGRKLWIARKDPFRVLTVIDQFTRECVALVAAPTWREEDVAAVLEPVVQRRGVPHSITVDNGTEFQSRAMDAWAYRHHTTLAFIRPGKPVENTFIESFNGRLRDEGLNTQQFLSLSDAQRQLDLWRCDYNAVRPHSALGDRTPNEMRQAYEATEAGDTQVSPLRLTIDRQTGSQPDEEAPRLNVALV